jgi:hypothetical protein
LQATCPSCVDTPTGAALPTKRKHCRVVLELVAEPDHPPMLASLMVTLTPVVALKAGSWLTAGEYAA